MSDLVPDPGDTLTEPHLAEPRAENARTALRRQQILDAAEACFRQRGFYAASMAEITKSFGMSAGNIYRFFDSKEAIILALIERDLEQILQKLSQSLKESEIVDRVIEGMQECVTETPSRGLLDLEILAEASRNPKVADILRRNDRLLRNRLREVMLPPRPGAGRRGEREDLARIEALMALFDGVVIRALRNPDTDMASLEKVLRGMVRSVLER